MECAEPAVSSDRFHRRSDESTALPHTRPRERAPLVATLGLPPAVTSHAIASDSGRPFAIVIVGGSIVDLVMSALLVPGFSAWWGRPIDSLPPAEDPRSVHE